MKAPQHVAGFLHSITGKNAHGATLIRKCALQGIRYEAAGRHWHSFGAHHSNLLGALPIAMKQVLEVMEPPTIVFYRFLMASIGLGAILAVKKRLPPLRVFRKPRWLILLAVATAGLFGNFILFSSSLQYLSPTASQVIGQLSPVGMMVASVFILKEKMRSTQVVGALMLLSGTVMFLTPVWSRYLQSSPITPGSYLWGRCGDGLGELWRGAKVLLRRLASPQILFLLYTLCTIALFLWQSSSDSAA